MSRLLIGLGTNLGDRKENLEIAIASIQDKIGKVIKRSSLYETAPWGVLDQPDFINQCIEVETNLDPKSCLKIMLNIEKDMGRVRFQKWGQRLIDIDLLCFDNLILKEDDLVIPHPYLEERIFVIQPLAEIAPDYIHPIHKQNLKDLSLNCKDSTAIKVLKDDI